MDESAISTFNKYSHKQCKECVGALADALTDPRTHVLMRPWAADRGGLLELHVHAASLLDDPSAKHAYFFVTMLSVHNRWILSSTPSGKNLEDAIAQLEKTIEREKRRRAALRKADGAGTPGRAGSAP